MKKIFEHTFQNRHFRPPKIRGFGLGRTGEKFADSDANSESVTTLDFCASEDSYLCVNLNNGRVFLHDLSES